MSDQNPKQNEKNSITMRMVLAISFEFGFIITIPLIGLGSLGKWLSVKYDNRLYLAGALVLALLISTVWLYKNINKLYKKLTE